MNINVYKSIVKNSMTATACYKLLFDDQGVPDDYVFVEVNTAFEKLTGLKSDEIVGKRITQIIPGIRNSNADWISTYSDVVINGAAKEFKLFSDGVHEYSDFKVLSTEKNYFVTMFSEIMTPDDKPQAYYEDNLYISDIIDIPEIQSVVDEFYKITNIAMAIGNLNGELLVKSGFQDICKNFHRKNEASCANCTKSDIKLFQSAVSGEYMQYKCLNNMWDISTPIIVAGKIIGAIYLGQFIYEDDIVNEQVFRNQAKVYGFDEEKYLMALEKVPRVSHQKIKNIMNFYIKFANMVALLGYKNISIQSAHAKQEELIKSLKESEKRFASTINNIPDAILVLDEDLNIQYANEAIYEIANKHSPQLIGANAEEIWSKDDVQTFLPALKEALKTKKTRVIDTVMANSDNIKRNYLSTFVPIAENGARVQILGIFHDYTEQARIEEAKKYQDSLIKEMGAIAKIGGWEFDPVSGKGSWTDEVAVIHDLDTKLETNMQMGLSFYTGESKTRIENAIQTAINEAMPYDIELELITGKGNRKWVRTIGQPTVKDGKVVRIHGSFQDITAQKQAEQKIIESETRYRNLLEAAPVGIAVHAEEKIVFANPAGIAMLGASTPDQIIGRSIYDIIHPDSIEETKKRIERNMAGDKEIYPAESIYLKLDGTSIPVEVMATNLTYQGKPAVQIIVSDITDRIRANEAIQKLNTELEQMVEARTKQLTEANKELDTFTYSVSHDLKAPLRGIDGYSKLLLEEFEDQLNEEGKYFLNTIRQSVTRMNQLIEDLLAFSRLERKSWQSAQVDLNKLVNEQIKELAEDFFDGGGIINTNIPDISIKTQYEGISIAVKNLIENAIKYSPDTKNSVIEISAEEIHNNIIFKVKDKGLGFDMKYHDKIFNIFERLHRAEEYPGTGIGLAIVKRVADRLKGRVWAESEPGQGSTFYFEFPKEV